MSSRIFNHIKKVIIASAIVVICSPHAAYAFGSSSSGGSSFIQSLINKLFNIEQKQEEEYITPEEALEKLKGLSTQVESGTGNVGITDIESIINQMQPGDTQDQLSGILSSFDISSFSSTSSLLGGSSTSSFGIGSILNVLIDLLSSLVDGVIGLIGGTDLTPTDDMTITATTAESFATGYGVSLHANIYKNSNPDGNKWVLLIHPFMMSSETMANAVGPYYINAGYNILAIDLRGFGDSDGSVALGFLESLDAYDWLVKMNTDKATFGEIEHIIVHGTSLGAATTNFLSGIDGFMANGPKKMNLQSLKDDLNVVGLVEDCGYKDMEQFADASFIMSLGVGLTDDNFDYYSNALNSLKYCELPLLVIHGDSDTMVDYEENAPVICNTVNTNNCGGSAKLVTIDGGAHALIIMGSNDTYEEAVNSHIKGINGNANFAYERTTYDIESSSGGLLDSLLNMLKGLFN